MVGLHALTAFCVSFVVVCALTPLVRTTALRWKLGDKPNGRKIHTRTIPHLGGIAIVLGSVSAMITVLLAGGGTDPLPTAGRLVWPLALIVGLGLIDDIKNLRALQKLVVQIVAAVVIASTGLHLLTGVAPLDGNGVFVILFTSFYLVGISSSINLIDGHDGLAAGLCLISAAAFAVLAVLAGSQALLAVAVVVGGACIGFLLFNFPPGKIFMGDTGSMYLGMMLGIVACGFTMLQPSINTFVAVCFILAVPMMDSILAIARRLALRRPVFQADSKHVHHVLSSFGFSARQTLLILYLMQAVMALLGILAIEGSVLAVVVGVILLVVFFLAFLSVMVAWRPRSETVTPKLTPNSLPSLEK